jgi:hypothetical protein
MQNCMEQFRQLNEKQAKNKFGVVRRGILLPSGNKIPLRNQIIAPPFAKGGVGVGTFIWQLIKNYECVR